MMGVASDFSFRAWLMAAISSRLGSRSDFALLSFRRSDRVQAVRACPSLASRTRL